MRGLDDRQAIQNVQGIIRPGHLVIPNGNEQDFCQYQYKSPDHICFTLQAGEPINLATAVTARSWGCNLSAKDIFCQPGKAGLVHAAEIPCPVLPACHP
jgi:hypothetical protein